MLDITAISKTFHPGTPNARQALRQLSLHLEDGEFATIVGSNGAGKSTLFGAIAGSFYTDEGERAYLTAIAEEHPGWQESLGERQKEMLGTTIAFTMAGGSQAANVIPQEAYVICNIRVAPGETVAGAVAALQAVADRHQVELEVLRSNEPSPVTDPRGEAFVRVERAIQAAWPGTEVLPFLLSGGTDTKHFVSLCPNCLRFTAYRISADQQVRCHAIDENIDLDTIPNGVDFFKNLIQGL